MIWAKWDFLSSYFSSLCSFSLISSLLTQVACAHGPESCQLLLIALIISPLLALILGRDSRSADGQGPGPPKAAAA